MQTDKLLKSFSRSRVTLISIAILIALSLTSCDYVPKPWSSIKYRYRLTVSVETPKGTRSGYSVIEVESWDGGKVPFVGSCGTVLMQRVRGEAAAVDLGDGEYVFALLKAKDGGAGYYADAAFHERLPKRSSCGDWQSGKERAEIIAEQTSPSQIPPQLGQAYWGPRSTFPILVRFADRSDASTVAAVNPRDLTSSFGPGYRLLGASVAITNEPVTTRIDRLIPGLKIAEKRQSNSVANIGLCSKKPHKVHSFACSLNLDDFYMKAE